MCYPPENKPKSALGLSSLSGAKYGRPEPPVKAPKLQTRTLPAAVIRWSKVFSAARLVRMALHGDFAHNLHILGNLIREFGEHPDYRGIARLDVGERELEGLAHLLA